MSQRIRRHTGSVPQGIARSSAQASFSTDDVGGGGCLKAAFVADGSKLLLVTKQGLLQEKAGEDLPRLLDRDCKTLRTFLNNPTTDKATQKRLSFGRV